MNSHKPDLFFRLVYFAVLAFFASIPIYIVTGFFLNIFSSGNCFSMKGISYDDLKDAGIVFGILGFSIYLSYFLSLLSLRALTWSSGREDGNLLPPKIMKSAFLIFGALGISILCLSIYTEQYTKFLGGLAYIFIAVVALKRFGNTYN